MQEVTKIILPNKPHLDPIAAYWLLLHYGETLFPEIKTVPVEFWADGQSPDEQKLAEWRDQGVITFDVAGGTFDHHGTNKSSTLLVAEMLSVAQRPELQTLLRYIQEDDTAGLHNNFGDLAGVIKALYKRGDTIENIIAFTHNVLGALQNKEERWHVSAKQEFTKARIHQIKYRGRKIKLAVIASDDLDVANYAKQKGGIGIVIQRNSTGHTHIFTNALFRLNIKDIVAAIRVLELQKNNKPLLTGSILKKAGKLAQIQNWFYHDALNAMMNGSAALAQTPATSLSLEEITDLVVYGLVNQQGAIGEYQFQAHPIDFYQKLFTSIAN